MVLRRYHGPIDNMVSSNSVLHSNNAIEPSPGINDDRGFLSLAINHLKDNRNGGVANNTENQSNLVVTNADINEPCSNQGIDEKFDDPGNERK